MMVDATATLEIQEVYHHHQSAFHHIVSLTPPQNETKKIRQINHLPYKQIRKGSTSI